MPREKPERGDFITPTLNYVKYFDKPILLYWLNALSHSVFGQNEFAARLPCALRGLGAMLFTYFLETLILAPSSRPSYIPFYLAAGLAVLAEGLIGLVLPGAIIFWHLALMRRWQLAASLRLSAEMLLVLALVSPWFIVVCWRNPEFFQFFFIHEHFVRFLTKTHSRSQPSGSSCRFCLAESTDVSEHQSLNNLPG